MTARWLIGVLLAFGSPVSSTGAESPDGRAMTLQVRPILCITDERTPVCEMSFHVLWQSDQAGYYCLNNDLLLSSLRCWTGERQGELHDQQSVEDSFSYWMTGDDSDTRLAEITVEVLRLETDDRRRKRRTRHVWDIF